MRRTLMDILWELPYIISYWGLPRGCWHCEVLGMCRHSKAEGWKCHNGCLILNWENEAKYEGLPRGCWDCEYLSACRRPKEEGWKCYDGCIKISLSIKSKAKELNMCKTDELLF